MDKKFFSCATTRLTRRYFPKAILKTDKELKTGDYGGCIPKGGYFCVKMERPPQKNRLQLSALFIIKLKPHKFGGRRRADSSFSSRIKRGPTALTGRARKRKYPDGRQTLQNSTRLTNVGDHLPIKGTRRRCAHCSTKQK